MRWASIRYRFRRFIFTFIYIYMYTIYILWYIYIMVYIYTVYILYIFINRHQPMCAILTVTTWPHLGWWSQHQHLPPKRPRSTRPHRWCAGESIRPLVNQGGESELSNGCGNSFPWFSMVFWGSLGISGDSEIWRFPRSSSQGCHGIPSNHPF